MSVLVDLSVFPVGKGESVSSYVAKAVEIVKHSGLSYTLGPMGTTVEGEWDQVHSLINSCFKEMMKQSDRVYMTVKVDYRKGTSGRIRSKVESVERKI
ncbi:MAG: MTH1187 family thiamine-binding protein [Desulfobacterales bacterium]|nr:MTH1187 family thiamine-binding protein [Desulfobacterales bacterium]